MDQLTSLFLIVFQQPRLQALTMEREVSFDDFGDGESEEENDGDEDTKS